jgi:hypothetical protein
MDSALALEICRHVQAIISKPSGGNYAAPTGASQSAAQHIPGNFTTHRSAWRDAITECINREMANSDRAAYWEHELAAYDRAFTRLLDKPEQRTPPAAMPAQASATPVAWAVFVPDGNCRIWFGDIEAAKRWKAGYKPALSSEPTPLYAHPPAPAPAIQAQPNYLHAAIMNIPVNGVKMGESMNIRAYKLGHRDARHAAAELVAASEHIQAQLLTDAELIALVEEYSSGQSMTANYIFRRARILELLRKLSSQNGEGA